MERDLGNGYVLDDDPARIDREAVHSFLSGEAYAHEVYRRLGFGDPDGRYMEWWNLT